VLNDAALGKDAGRFVWLSIDTEKEQNRAFLDGHPVEVWPTLMVLDPDGAPVLRWAGALSVPQLAKLLDDGERAVAGKDALARADRLAADGKPADAARAYQTALDGVPEASRPRVVEALVLSLDRQHDAEACATTARTWTPKLPRGSSFANVAAMGLSCALEAPKSAAWRAPAIAELSTAATSALEIRELLADDRSGVYEALVEARRDAGDAAGVKSVAGAWLGFLEAEAARAPSPEARAAFDPHRLSAALALGDPARAIPALQASERELPRDYNPPARLAIAYRALGRVDDGLAASERALARAYGPRRLRLLDVKADLQLKKGDRAGARATVEQALQIARALPAAQKGAVETARWQKRLDELR